MIGRFFDRRVFNAHKIESTLSCRNHFVMLFLFLSSCVSLATKSKLVKLHIDRCVFLNGMDQASTTQGSGALVDAISARVCVSRLSVLAEQESSMSLFKCYGADVSVRYCFLKDLRSQFGCFLGSNVNIDSSAFSNSARPLEEIANTDSERIRRWQATDFLTCRNVIFENLQAPDNGRGGAIYYGSDQWKCKVSLNNCTFRNCRCGPKAETPEGAAVFVASPVAFEFNYCNVLECHDNAASIISFQGSTTSTTKEISGQITMYGNVFKDIKLNTGGSGMVVWAPTDISYVQCEFVSCVSSGTSQYGGSCIRLRPIVWSNTRCNFEECNFSVATSSSGNGGAIRIYYQDTSTTTTQYVSLTGCTFEQCGTEGEHGGGLCINADTSPQVQVVITNTTMESCYARQGGSISVVTAVAGRFEVANCSFTDGKASGGNGGFLMISSCTGQVILQDTTFLNSSASGDGGCVYLGNTNPSEVLVENCTIDSCESSAYSIVLKCPTTTIDCLHMKNMPNGGGRIQLSDSGFTDGSLSLTNCEFENFETQKLFDYTGSLSTLVLIFCRFDNVVVSGENLFQLTRDWKNFTFDNCTFQNIVSLGSIVKYDTGGASGDCIIDNSVFQNITIGPKGTDSSTSYEVIIDVRNFNSVTLKYSQFLDSTLMNGIFLVPSMNTEISLEFVLFSGCEIDRPNGAAGEKYALVSFSGVIQKFVECQFISCSYPQSSIVSLSRTISTPISNCVFENCSCTESNLFYISPQDTEIAFEQCSFQSMALALPVIGFPNTGYRLKFVDTSFLSLSMPDEKSLLPTVTRYDIENITVSSCSFRWFTSSSATITGSRFSSNTIKSTTKPAMFYVESREAQSLEISECNITSCNEEYVLKIDRSAVGSKLTLSMCRFEDCSAKSPNLFDISFGGDFRLENCSFDDCSCDSGSLILVQQGGSIYVGGCCFRGTTSIDGIAAYINSTLSIAEFELPLCFDLDESHSVYFNGSRPWSEVSSEYQIFECSYCVNFPVITSIFTASSAFTASLTFTPSATFTEVISETASETMSPSSSEDQGGSGLSPGAVAGIVVGVLVIVAGVVVFLVLFLLRRKKQTDDSSGITEMSDETVESASVTAAPETASEWNGQVTEEATVTQLTTVDDFMQPFEEAIDY